MTDKFRKTVKVPENAAARLRRAAEKLHPREFVRDMRMYGEDEKLEFKDAAAIIGLGLAKGMAWMTAGGAQLLLTLARWTTMDNAFLRKMENHFAVMDVGKNKRGQPKKLSSFAKKYPNLSAHILWIFGLGLVSGGTYAGVKYVPDKIQTVKEARAEQEAARQAEEAARGTYRAFLNKMQPITPFLIADLIAKEGVHIDEKTGLHVPYRDSRGIPTIGFGSTVLKNGQRVTMNTPPITTAEAYETARWHLEEGETYFVLYCYDTALKNVDVNTTNEALGMSSVIYNAYTKLIEEPNDRNCKERFAHLRNLLDEYGFAVPDSLVQQLFEQYPIRAGTSFGQEWINGASKDVMANRLGRFLSGGRGLYWRRWLEAGLLTGDITPQMLLSCPVNGMYEFFRVMDGKKSAFFIGDIENRRVNKDTFLKFKQWLANPVSADGFDLSSWKKIGDFLPSDVLAYCQNGECELDNPNFNKNMSGRDVVLVKTYTMGYDAQYKNAMAAYVATDYDSAASQFEKMITEYPNNALLRNDLAATYNKIGRFSDAVAQAREILHRIGDKSQYAAAQYNAGFAYEQMGDLERALLNYQLAVKNGNVSVAQDVSRVQRKIKSGKTIAFYDALDQINADGEKRVRGDINNIKLNKSEYIA